MASAARETGISGAANIHEWFTFLQLPMRHLQAASWHQSYSVRQQKQTNCIQPAFSDQVCVMINWESPGSNYNDSKVMKRLLFQNSSLEVSCFNKRKTDVRVLDLKDFAWLSPFRVNPAQSLKCQDNVIILRRGINQISINQLGWDEWIVAISPHLQCPRLIANGLFLGSVPKFLPRLL